MVLLGGDVPFFPTPEVAAGAFLARCRHVSSLSF